MKTEQKWIGGHGKHPNKAKTNQKAKFQKAKCQKPEQIGLAEPDTLGLFLEPFFRTLTLCNQVINTDCLWSATKRSVAFLILIKIAFGEDNVAILIFGNRIIFMLRALIALHLILRLLFS